MFKHIQLFSIITLTTILIACGGGSSNSSGTSVVGGPSSTVKITAQCNESNNKVTVTKDGCIFLAGGTQTGMCTNNPALKILSGTGHTAKEVSEKGSSFSKDIILNSKTISCSV